MHTAQEARFYLREADGTIQCQLCPHRCRISAGQKGVCRTRFNDGHRLVAQTYGQIASYGKDPIEKKPLYHFHPGSKIFSIGSFGCNFRCGFCQNYNISQQLGAPLIQTTPQNLADIASNEADNLGIAYTYNEPTVWYEFMHDIAVEIRKHGKKNVMVTNGFMNLEPLEQLLPLMDAMNIDLKSMNPEFYTKTCGGRLEPVQEFIRRASGECHVEITTLLIGGLNTDPKEIEALAAFIASIRPDIPLHLSRYFPAYQMDLPATEVALMRELQAVAQGHLKHVYLGNVPEADRNTRCHSCGTLLVDRTHGVVTHLRADGCCPDCGAASGILLEGRA